MVIVLQSIPSTILFRKLIGGVAMNKAVIAFWSFKDKKGNERWGERLLGIYETEQEAHFIMGKVKKNFEFKCEFKVEDNNNPITHKASVTRFMEHLRGLNR